eukprot:PRCOL_00003101-RA
MGRVGIFYATGTNTTKDLAYKIKEGLGDAADEPDKVMYLLAEDMAKYDALILGCPSYLWGGGSVSGLDFDTMVPPAGNPVDLQGTGSRLAGVRVAVFGTGDQVKYSEYFADAMGMVADRMLSRGCIPIGQTSVEGYEFEYSRAQREDQFVGLVIDNENQPELTDVRVAAWVEQLKKEIGLPA